MGTDTTMSELDLRERIRRLELALASTLETSPLSGLAPSRVLTGTETNADVAALEELQRLR